MIKAFLFVAILLFGMGCSSSNQDTDTTDTTALTTENNTKAADSFTQKQLLSKRFSWGVDKCTGSTMSEYSVFLYFYENASVKYIYESPENLGGPDLTLNRIIKMGTYTVEGEKINISFTDQKTASKKMGANTGDWVEKSTTQIQEKGSLSYVACPDGLIGFENDGIWENKGTFIEQALTGDN